MAIAVATKVFCYRQLDKLYFNKAMKNSQNFDFLETMISEILGFDLQGQSCSLCAVGDVVAT